jgi:hypothetical protein
VLGRYREIRPVHSGRLLGKPLDVNVVISLSSARAATYTISSYHGGLAEVPCDAFKKNADGSWTQIAILIGGRPYPGRQQFQEHGREPHYREEVRQGMGIGAPCDARSSNFLANQTALSSWVCSIIAVARRL